MAELSGQSPVFVIGTLRSGASLLSLALSQHPRLQPVLEHTWLKEFVTGLVRSYRAASRHRAVSQLDIDGIELEDFLAHFGSAALEMMGARQASGRVLLDATPANLFLVAPLRLLFPDAKFIHIVREVGEVVTALSNPELSAVYKSRYIECSAAAAYDHWLRGVSAGIEAERAFGSEVVYRVRRHDLIADPAATLGRCFEFLGLAFEDASLRPFSSVASSQAIWHAETGPNDRARTTASALSAMLSSKTSPFPGNPSLVDQMNAELWRRATRGERLVPPIPGSPEAVRRQRKQSTANEKLVTRDRATHRLGRIIERLRRNQSDVTGARS
jgi:hypothetical protein